MRIPVKIVLASLFSCAALFAQSPDTMWTKTFGANHDDFGLSVQQTIDRGYIVVGSTKSFGAGGSDVWLIKADLNGDTLWTKVFGGDNSDEGRFVQQTSDSGYIVISTTHSFGAGFGDIWLIKTDANGDTLWTKTFGGVGDESANLIQQTSDNGYIIIGNPGNYDVWLIKTDSDGDSLWTKTLGGIGEDWCRSIQQTFDDGYIIAGSTIGYGTGIIDVWLIKTDANGDPLWTKTFGGSDVDWGSWARQTLDGGYILTGYTESFGAGNRDLWLIKTNANGDTLWTRTFGGIGDEWGNSVQQTSDGGYIITGGTDDHAVWLIRTDANGNCLWTKTLGISEDYGNSVQQTSDGGYIIAGSTSSYGVGSSFDVWLIKIAPEVTAIDGSPQVVIYDYSLQQNYPNPFNSMTRIRYSIYSTQFVSLKVYDLLGKHIATLVNEQKPVGDYTVEFHPINLSSGIYFYQLEVGNSRQARKMILLK